MGSKVNKLNVIRSRHHNMDNVVNHSSMGNLLEKCKIYAGMIMMFTK